MRQMLFVMEGSGEGSNAARRETDWVKRPPMKEF